MPIAFLAPIFIAGLALLAVPVIIHLTHRQRKEVTEFPSLMFLRQIPYRTVRRQRIRHWLLFALRCLAIILIVVAFARPLLRRGGATGGGTGSRTAREIVILLDRSYSMGYGDRWSRALDAARRVVESMRPADRATLVLFANSAEAAGRPTSDHATLNTMLASARLSSGATRYAPAIALAGTILGETELPRREVVLITDFQRSGWTGESDARLPSGTTITAVDLSDPDPSDVAVASVSLKRSRDASRERVAATGRLTNIGAEPATREVRVAVNGRTLEVKKAIVPAKGAAMVEFTPFALPEGMSRLIVSSESDALPANDSSFLVLAPLEVISVLIVDDAAAPADASLYLRRALEIGDDPPFRVEVRKSSRVVQSELRGRDVVILNDVRTGAGSLLALHDFVRRGGGLLVALGDRGFRGGWSGDTQDLLPLAIGSVADRLDAGSARLATLDYTHPVFEPFRAPRSGDWSSARFFRYGTTRSNDSTAVLARYDDGAIALAERQIGKGMVVLWTTTLDGTWNDLPLQPVFLPFVHQLAKHLARYSPQKHAWAVGEVATLPQNSTDEIRGDEGTSIRSESTAARPSSSTEPTRLLPKRPELVARAPSGATLGFAPGAAERYVELQEQGFYEIRTVGSSGVPVRTLAANLDPTESDMTRIDPGVVVSAVAPRAPSSAGASDTVSLTAEAQEQRQALWWYLLIAALLALAAETVLSNRLSRHGAVG